MQKRLNELRVGRDSAAVDKLAARFNAPGRDRIAVMWEVAVLHGLSKQGSLTIEAPLPSGRRPDVNLEVGELHIVADITAVSDDGLDDMNPYHELSELIESAKGDLGLPIGGTDLRISSKREFSKRGIRTSLRLPPRNQLRDFVRNELAHSLREQIKLRRQVLHISIDDNEVGLEITIDPSRSPFSSASFAAYDVPTIRDKNPLYNALKSKAGQLREAPGIKGVIVGDADCAAISHKPFNSTSLSAAEIVAEFFRQHSSIDFVAIITITESTRSWSTITPPTRKNQVSLSTRPDTAPNAQLEEVFSKLASELPVPMMMPANGALRAREAGYDLGHHGGYTLSGEKLRISLREFTEVLAGLRRFDDGGAKNIEASRALDREASTIHQIINRNLMLGRLPTSIDVSQGDENESDGWVEIEFGRPDPAISPLT